MTLNSAGRLFQAAAAAAAAACVNHRWPSFVLIPVGSLKVLA